MKIIFAQGNPGAEYTKSRHNIGFVIVDKLASNLGLKWQDSNKFKALVAETVIAGEKTLLVKPQTFYNETGQSICQIMSFYKLEPIDSLLVIHDDFALPFGTIRVRDSGSDAGNNGIKSINSCINPNYTRIRIGIWTELREKMNDADFVLAKFHSEESKNLQDKIVPKSIELINQFWAGPLENTSYSTLE